MSIFDLSETLESINGGATRYDMQQVYPITGAIQDGTVIGTAAASGLTTFQFQDSATWWCPTQSYFNLRLTFFEAGTAGMTDPIAYADNFVCTLFTQLLTYINSKPLDTVNTPHLIDTALTYSHAKKTFLDSWGSLTRVGEPLTTRIRNINRSANVTSPGQIELVFRPPVSLFDAKILPPGAMFRFDFNWASSGINAFESPFGSLTWGTAAGNVQIQVNSFTFYKATVQPGNIQLPMRGVIDLCPAVANQYFANGAQALKQNITLPSTCNRILLVLQDTASTTVSNAAVPANNWCGVGNGYNPATSFSDIFTVTGAGTTGNNLTYGDPNGVTSISQLWISLPELGVQEPNPIYAFNGSPMDKMRAYSDFCHIVQGTAYQSEGSIPYGSDFYTNGVTIMAIDTATAANNLSQVGDPNNPQQYWYMITGAGIGTINVNSYNQTALWGWAGRCPGPIFAFPVVRPEGKPVSIGTLNMVFNAGVKSVTATLIASYSMAIVVELQQNGLYAYSLVEGV